MLANGCEIMDAKNVVPENDLSSANAKKVAAVAVETLGIFA